MKITDIEKKSGENYTVYVDGEYWYILNIEVIMRCGLRIGQEVDDDFLCEIKETAMRRKARERAYYLLDFRAHSKKEIYDKLLKSVDEHIALETVLMLEEQGLLNDEEYAARLAQYYLESKKWGQKKAYYELLKRGISKETASEAVNLAAEETDITANIKAIIEKKYYDKIGDYKSQQKVIAALLRLGYKISDIKTAVFEVIEENQE